MRFASVFLLVVAPLYCRAQTVIVTNTQCAAARIITPNGEFKMPVAKTPEMQTMKGSVISTSPACAQEQPKPVIAKLIRVAPFVQPGGLQLMPNPFTPLAK
jgi:hypothetical protein